MDVTRTIWFEGSVDECRLLQSMLEKEGVRVELPLWVRDREQQQKTLDQVRAQLAQIASSSSLIDDQRLAYLETEEQEDQRLLRNRQEREWQELQQRHEREQQELNQSYTHRRQKLEADIGLAQEQSHAQASLAFILADVNQVIVSLVSTGAALAIAEAVKKYRKQHPQSKVEVMGETTEVEEKETGVILAIARAAKKFGNRRRRSKVEVVGEERDRPNVSEHSP